MSTKRGTKSPESQLVSSQDCINIEQTISYQTSQWRERSVPLLCWSKGKWKLMNKSQVTVAWRQFITTVLKKRKRKGWQRGREKEHEDQAVYDVAKKKKKIVDHYHCSTLIEYSYYCKATSHSPLSIKWIPIWANHQWMPLIWMLLFFLIMSNQHSSGLCQWDTSRTTH